MRDEHVARVLALIAGAADVAAVELLVENLLGVLLRLVAGLRVVEVGPWDGVSDFS